MEGPLPGETAFMITVFPVPGKYELIRLVRGLIPRQFYHAPKLAKKL